MSQQPLHLKGLNGLRAIAAMAVVFSHITLSLHEFGLNPFLFGATPEGTPRGLDLAGFGVSIFFSLSGFLITYLLLLEQSKKEINIKNFYIRRVLRIWPLYYLYLAIALAVISSINFDISKQAVFHYLFYSANIPFIFGGALPFLYHFWSLGVEEQFYIFWPWLVKKSSKKLLTATLILTVVLIGLKIVSRLLWADGTFSLLYNFLHITRFQCMLIGAIGAILYYRQHSIFLKILTSKFLQFLSWGVIILILLNRFHIVSVIDNELVSIFTVAIIVGQITEKNRIINLETRLFEFFGKISYGLYVIHPLIIFGCIKIFKTMEVNYLLKYVFVYGGICSATVLFAYLSYEHFECWFLRLKHKYSIVNTSVIKDRSSDTKPFRETYAESKKTPAYV